MPDKADAKANEQARTYQCPNCNGVLSWSITDEKLVCSHCGKKFDEDEHLDFSVAVSADENPAEESPEHVDDIDGFLDRMAWSEGPAEELENARVYSCSTCGGKVVADQSVVATSCPYCGNNLSVGGIATADNFPSKIVPFAVTKEQAQKGLHELFKGKWYLSRSFEPAIEHMQGVYVPYYLYDVKTEGKLNCVGEKMAIRDIIDKQAYCAVQRSGSIAFENVAVDGSSKMPDAHMDAINPFSAESLRGFSFGYVSGYLMEVPDEPAEQCVAKAKNLAERSFEKEFEDDMTKDEGISAVTVVKKAVETEVDNTENCALPVWLIHSKWEDEDVLFAVNGESGKCIGDLPIDKSRRKKTLISAAVFMLLVQIVFWLVFVTHADVVDKIFFFIVCLVLFQFPVLLLDGYLSSKMKTAKEHEDASLNRVPGSMNVTHAWKSRFNYRSFKEAKSVLEHGEADFLKEGIPQPEPWNE